MINYFPDEVLEHIFSFISSHKHRNSISLVCKSWYKIEKFSRQKVFIGNCYSISPERVVARFPELKSLTLKGKPHFADFNLVPDGWGGFVFPWIEELAKAKIGLEELRLKRMVVSDDSLELISRAFPNFKSLVLVSCEGFTTDGIASIAANCRLLRELDLQENDIEDHRGHWLNSFPENSVSLESLNFGCLKGEVNPASLERLVSRSPKLKSLKLNHAVSLDTLQMILVKAPQLVELGTGCQVHNQSLEDYTNFEAAVQKCSSLKSLSGFLGVFPRCVVALHAICPNLTSLNLSYSPRISGAQLTKLIPHCHKLQCLWVLDRIGDKGLEVVGSTCKELKELRVFPSDPFGVDNTLVSEEGLVAISAGCPKLTSLLYFCHQMTNLALITIAKNSPNFTCFRLCILDPTKPDANTQEPLDEGYGAIIRTCKGIRRLSLSGLLTDKTFLYISKYAERLEMLSIAFAGDSDKAMVYVLNGCKKLRKLEIMNSPFGDAALLVDMRKYENMRSLWMSSCEITLGGCKTLAKKMGRLNVEIMNENEQTEFKPDDDTQKVDKMYLYRSVVGARKDAPDFVWTL